MAEAEHTFGGVMMGILVCNHGDPHIAIDVNGSRIVMSVAHAGVLFNQLGDLLDACGHFNEDEEEMEVVRGPTLN